MATDQLYDNRSGLRNHLMAVLPVADKEWFYRVPNLAAIADPTVVRPNDFVNLTVCGYCPVGANLYIAAGNQGTLARATVDIVGVDCWGIKIQETIELVTDRPGGSAGFNGFMNWTRRAFARVDGIRIRDVTAGANDVLEVGYPLPRHRPIIPALAPTSYLSAPGVCRDRTFQFPHAGDWTFLGNEPYCDLILDTTDANALHLADGDRLIVTDEQKTVRFEITAGAPAAGHEAIDLTAWVTGRDARADIMLHVQSHHGYHMTLANAGTAGHTVLVKDGKNSVTFELGATVSSPEHVQVTIGGSAALSAVNLGTAINAAVTAGRLDARLYALVDGAVVRLFSTDQMDRDFMVFEIGENGGTATFSLARHYWGMTPFPKEWAARQHTTSATADRAAIRFHGGTRKMFVECLREAAGAYSFILTGAPGTAKAVDFNPKRLLVLDPLATIPGGSMSMLHGDVFSLRESGLEDLYEFDDTVAATDAATKDIDISSGDVATIAPIVATVVNGGAHNTSWRAAHDNSSNIALDAVLLCNAPAHADALMTEGVCSMQWGEYESLGYNTRAPSFRCLSYHFELQSFGFHSAGAMQIGSSFDCPVWDLWQMSAGDQPGINFRFPGGGYAGGAPRFGIYDNSGAGGEPNTATGNLSGMFFMQRIRDISEAGRTHQPPNMVSHGGPEYILGPESQRLGHRAGGAGVTDRPKIRQGRRVHRR